MTTGFVYDPAFLRHATGPGHPESPARLTAVMQHLESRPWFGELKRYSPEPCATALIEAVHDPVYITRVEAACLEGEHFLDSMDTVICEQSYAVALLAAGALVRLGDAVMAGDIANGMALVRPPGHHAERDRAMGFCLFNNVAILARYLQHRHGLEKILILDWDVHHGNGTQHCFYDDPTVLYISTHQDAFYPGTGAARDTGHGAGTGFTLNCPMPAGSDDDDYTEVFSDRILPAIDAFEPEFIIISAGFDAHAGDPLAQMRLSTEFYGWVTMRVMELAAAHCQGRIVSSLEGGYDLDDLAASVAEHVRVMAGES